MTHLTITNIDNGSVNRGYIENADELLVFAGAGTVVKGTLLARQAVTLAITPASEGNTGDGTCTAATVVAGPVVPFAGTYNLECIAEAANGGTFKLEDPNGMLLTNTLVMTAGAGGSTVFETNGLQLTLTDGAEDFDIGDSFDLPVVADLRMVPFATDGAGGAQIPIEVAGYDIEAAGAGNVSCRPIYSGYVVTERLVIDADGDNSNITAAILDQLKDANIIPISETDPSVLDNQ